MWQFEGPFSDLAFTFAGCGGKLGIRNIEPRIIPDLPKVIDFNFKFAILILNYGD
jgi:hypothetical protein